MFAKLFKCFRKPSTHDDVFWFPSVEISDEEVDEYVQMCMDEIELEKIENELHETEMRELCARMKKLRPPPKSLH